MRLGASTIPFRGDPLTSDVLASFREAGIESLELCDYHPNFDYTDPEFRAFLRLALDDMEFHLNSIHVHMKHRDPDSDLASLGADQRDKAISDHKQRSHSLLGVEHDGPWCAAGCAARWP